MIDNIPPDLNMNIYAKHGDFVVFTHPGNGYPAHQKHAAQFLDLGKIYTVDWTDVGNSHTDVHLVEFHDTCFNSVHFSDYQEVN